MRKSNGWVLDGQVDIYVPQGLQITQIMGLTRVKVKSSSSKLFCPVTLLQSGIFFTTHLLIAYALSIPYAYKYIKYMPFWYFYSIRNAKYIFKISIASVSYHLLFYIFILILTHVFKIVQWQQQNFKNIITVLC